MRKTVPRLSGICRRGPSVGSSAAVAIRAGVSLVRQMSLEYHSGSTALTCTNGAGPSEITMALPSESCPVTTRLTCLAIAILSLRCSIGFLVRGSSAACCTPLPARVIGTAGSVLAQPSQYIVELIETAIVDLQHAAVAAMIDRDGQAKRIGNASFERKGIGALERALAHRLARFLPAVLRQRLDLTDVEPAIDDLARHLLRVGRPDEHARGAGRDLAGMDISLDRFGQLQQAQRVGDVAAALADDLGNVVVTVIVLARESLITARLFQRIEVRALHVLDDRKLERFAIAYFEQYDRDIMQARALRRAPAPLACNDLIGVLRSGDRAHDHGLDDAAFLDRRRQIIELRFQKIAAWISRIGPHIFDRHAALIARAFGCRGFGPHVTHQRGKAAPQSRSAFVRHRHVSRPLQLTLHRAAGSNRSRHLAAASVRSIPSRAG